MNETIAGSIRTAQFRYELFDMTHLESMQQDADRVKGRGIFAFTLTLPSPIKVEGGFLPF